MSMRKLNNSVYGSVMVASDRFQQANPKAFQKDTASQQYLFSPGVLWVWDVAYFYRGSVTVLVEVLDRE